MVAVECCFGPKDGADVADVHVVVDGVVRLDVTTVVGVVVVGSLFP